MSKKIRRNSRFRAGQSFFARTSSMVSLVAMVRLGIGVDSDEGEVGTGIEFEDIGDALVLLSFSHSRLSLVKSLDARSSSLCTVSKFTSAVFRSCCNLSTCSSMVLIDNKTNEQNITLEGCNLSVCVFTFADNHVAKS